MRRESRKGETGGQWEAEGETRRGCAYDGHVGETQRDIRRAHSWAPRCDVKSYLSLGPRCFIRRSAVPRCTMHTPCGTTTHTRALRCLRRIDALDFYSIYIGGLDRSPEKRLAPATLLDRNDLRRRPTIVAGPACFSAGEKFIFNLYSK